MNIRICIYLHLYTLFIHTSQRNIPKNVVFLQENDKKIIFLVSNKRHISSRNQRRVYPSDTFIKGR